MSRHRRLPPADDEVAPQSVLPWQDEAISDALDAWMNAVMRLDGLDPLTTELVRLRCATNHDCRFCLSVRLEVEGERTVDDTTARQVADYEHGSLSERHKAALRLADAMMTQPSEIGDDLVSELRRHFNDAELLEVTLDVMKFSHQKIKVSLGLDEPAEDGTLATFVVDADGRAVF